MGELEAVLAELFLRGETVGVGGEVALQVRPAELAAAQRQAAVCPPAVRGDDCLGVSEQSLGVILVAVARDLEERVTAGE